MKVCPKCKRDELIRFIIEGHEKNLYKCQSCKYEKMLSEQEYKKLKYFDWKIRINFNSIRQIGDHEVERLTVVFRGKKFKKILFHAGWGTIKGILYAKDIEFTNY